MKNQQTTIDNFVFTVLETAKKQHIQFDVLSGLSGNKVDVVSSSDIDIICRTHTDMIMLTEIACSTASKYPEINLVSKRIKKDTNIHLIYECKSTLLMFDLHTMFGSENIIYFNSRVYFEMKDHGLDAQSIARFIKIKTNFKQSWPGTPSELYSFRILPVRITDKLFFYLNKLISCINSYFRHKKLGVFVVGLGSDGVGKSSVFNALCMKVNGKRTIIPTYQFHWCPPLSLRLRPCLTENNIVRQPHNNCTWSVLLSTVKLGYLLLKYNIGFHLHPSRVLYRGGIVLADRYYHDLLVDPKRYRYGGSMRLARLVLKLVPQPDVIILFDATTEVTQARKKEVSFKECKRQNEAYQCLVKKLPNGHIVDASQPLDKVVADVEKIVLDFMRKRTAKRLSQG